MQFSATAESMCALGAGVHPSIGSTCNNNLASGLLHSMAERVGIVVIRMCIVKHIKKA
jgi:hypothetical protein